MSTTQDDLDQIGADYAEKHEWYVNHVGGIAEVPLDELGRLSVRDGGISEEAERRAFEAEEALWDAGGDVTRDALIRALHETAPDSHRRRACRDRHDLRADAILAALDADPYGKFRARHRLAALGANAAESVRDDLGADLRNLRRIAGAAADEYGAARGRAQPVMEVLIRALALLDEAQPLAALNRRQDDPVKETT